jgi:hypothetical protein
MPIIHYQLPKEEYDRLQKQYEARANEIVDAIHCPEMNTTYKSWMIRNLWVHVPNYWADYFTIGYRLEQNNSTSFGYHSPTKLIEIYYAKISAETVNDPEWLPKFADQFKARYYEQLDKCREAGTT